MNEPQTDRHSNGRSHWFERMTSTLVALLLASAAGSGVWTAIQANTTLTHLEAIEDRLDSIDNRLLDLRERIRQLEKK